MFSGAANVTGGSVIINPNSRHYAELHDAMRSRYGNVSCFPQDISVLRDNSINLVERVRKANQNTVNVLCVFASHCAVARVNYPSRFCGLEYTNYERRR
ncbi:uncharacterized protein LW93_9779 [Fusarium fujikuroi]|nr:uncharacterized protein LW93_9779 [Fusarium fujikuroi]